MSDPFFQQMFADRIGGANYGKGTAIYKFEKIKRAKRKAAADYPDRSLLNFGIGENDAMAPESVRQVMAAEINKPENRGYADNGIALFKEAVARFMKAASWALNSIPSKRSITALGPSRSPCYRPASSIQATLR